MFFSRKQRIKNIDAIKKHEALRLTAYLPTKNDVWTIGYGHTKGVTEGMVITEAQAEAYLREDIAWVEDVIDSTVKVPLTQNQRDALGSLIFNIGGTAFRSSTVLKRLNDKNYSGAADAFLMWVKQKGVVLKGLVNRRNEERKLFNE